MLEYHIQCVRYSVSEDPDLRFVFSNRSSIPYILKEDDTMFDRTTYSR